MSTKPKYFVGNWVRCKEDGWTGIILAVETTHKKDILYKIGHFFEPEAYFGEHYWESEITELFDTIPYPWQEFFKVGDKVKILGTQKIGSIIKMSAFAESIKPLYIKSVYMKGKECVDTYAPHELIKIGDNC